MERVTVDALKRRKGTGPKLAILTAYDYPMGRLLDAAGVDAVLVGDSLAMVVLGHETTADVTMEEMLHHAKAVRRGVSRALLIGDMPLAALRGSPAEAVTQARRFLREAGCGTVKVEWRPDILETVGALVREGIPVMGHVGLTPQTAGEEGGFGLRGKDAAAAERILDQAVALERAGCWAVVLECLPAIVAERITAQLAIPTVGIGAGAGCDGQVLVTHDVVGLFDRFTPRFVKRYAEAGTLIREAARAFVREVQAGGFPGPEHTWAMAPEEAARWRQARA